MSSDLGDSYLATRERVLGLVGGLGEEALVLPVPATPGWNVHDVLAHVVGITDDALKGNMAGAPGEDWTAAQVVARTDASLRDLLAEWEANAQAFAAAVAAAGIAPAVLDLACHEQDLRGALGVSGARDNDVIAFAASSVAPGLAAKPTLAGLGPLRIVVDGEGIGASQDEAAVTLTTDRFELFRAMFGRRSEAQLRAMAWSADPSPYLEHLVIFGPSELDIVE